MITMACEKPKEQDDDGAVKCERCGLEYGLVWTEDGGGDPDRCPRCGKVVRILRDMFDHKG